MIGGRYGSPSASSKRKVNRGAHNYNSFTKEEYLAARNAGVPIYTFVKKEVITEFGTYRNLPENSRDGFLYSQVDDYQIFKLIEEIFNIKRGLPVFTYDSATDIIRQLKNQLAGAFKEHVENLKKQSHKLSKTQINAYKLFFFRKQKELSFGELSKLTGISKAILRRLEIINTKKDTLDPSIFKWCDISDILKLEEELDCPNTLQTGYSDDFLSLYMQYYSTYKGKKKPIACSLQNDEILFPTKAVAFDFDFDGTLTRRTDNFTSWEKIWMALGYSIEDCARYHRQYTNGEISHAQWCEITCQKFRERGLKENQLREIAKSIELLPGSVDTLNKLRKNNIKIYLLSGSITNIIKYVLGDLYEVFDDVRANSFIFDHKGLIER